MSADSVCVNTPACAWAWLARQFSSLDEISGRSTDGEWSQFRSENDGQETKLSFITDWPSDFWIAKTQNARLAHMIAVWSIPERLDQWPTLEMQGPLPSTLPRAKTTNSASFLDLLNETDPTHVLSLSDPVHRFYELLRSSSTHADEAMISACQVRAWLTTAFGDLLSGIALTPVSDDQTRERVVQEITQRFADVDSLSPEDRRFSFVDYGCDLLYNLHMTQDGLQTTSVRQGQGKDWQQHWAWLSIPQDASAMKATLQLAGLLLVNRQMLLGLTSTIRNGDEGSRKRALCVTRRWLLTAKVLAWMFEALQHDWTEVRPQDLACFGFGALSPAWPRRAVAVSHRSAEAKPVLSTLKMWKSPHIAIDASYVPAWETNRGMIWSLFASVPLIARVESAGYFESEWCRREHEMFQYLLDNSDFLEGRAIVDIGVDQLTQLDASLFEDGAARTSSQPDKLFPTPRREFPPFSLVLVGGVPSGIDLAVLRAAGALRLINLLTQNPALANEVASHAAAGRQIDMEAPTNNPDGWAPYAEVFRDLNRMVPVESVKRSLVDKLRRRALRRSLSIRVPDDYSAVDVQRDRESAEQLPDLSRGEHRLADVLAALEWRRTVFDWFMREGFGDKVMVDVSGSDADEWATRSHLSVARGLLTFNSFTPTWIMQDAGQNAHLWPGFREQPIFTRHVDDQFNWLKPVLLDPCWLVYYLANCGLGMEPSLQAAMISAVVHAAGPEAVKFERQAEGVSLVVPEPRAFFTMPTDALHDVYNLIGLPADPPPQ